MGAETGREMTYQWMLRALGAYMDDEPSCRISLAEAPDGFLVRLQRALHKLEPNVIHFKRESLREQLDQLMKQNRPVGPRIKHQGVWSHFPNGHQDFLRALGYELDQASAQGILLDELEEGIVLTYSYPEPSGDANGTGWKKRMVVLGVPEIETILNAAFERRTKPAAAVDSSP
jgi:hypothetical protein